MPCHFGNLKQAKFCCGQWIDINKEFSAVFNNVTQGFYKEMAAHNIVFTIGSYNASFKFGIKLIRVIFLL